MRPKYALKELKEGDRLSRKTDLIYWVDNEYGDEWAIVDGYHWQIVSKNLLLDARYFRVVRVNDSMRLSTKSRQGQSFLRIT